MNAKKPSTKIDISMLDAFSFFERLGPAGESVLNALRVGFDAKVRNINTAMEYMKEVLKGVDMQKLSGPNAPTQTFEIFDEKIELTKANIMELYILNKREQARGHIYGYGIKRLDSKGKNIFYAPALVPEEDVERIPSTLTKKEIQIAEAMQKFLGNDVSQWGNYVSMTLWGYKKFRERNYWPIRSDSNYTRTLNKDGNSTADIWTLKNTGSTKATVEGANNALLLGDIFDTFVRHVDTMSSYNAFVIPLSDAMKWYNYTDGGVSVKQSIERLVGKRGQQYFINFIVAINGTSSSNIGLGWIQF